MSKAYSNIRFFSQTILRLAACSVALIIFTAAANAATFTVDTTDDDAALTACTAAANDCSLRGAIARANGTSDNDTINFALRAGSNTIDTSGELAINNAGLLTITNSTEARNLLIYGDGNSRVFLVNGGIANDGTLSLLNSTVSGNEVTIYDGGDIFNEAALTIINSTVSGNTARIGGGIYNSAAGRLTLTSVTVAFNSAVGGDGGGVRNFRGTANLRNTIVGQNAAATSSADFEGAIVSTSSFNLIGSGAGMTGITSGTGGNQVGIDPKLNSTLAPNGGTTRNHALLPDSPAIDKGSAAGTDQRGLTRPSDSQSIANAAGGNGADIGAFEVQFLAPTAASVSVSGRVVTAQGRGIRNVVVAMTDMQGNVRTAKTTAFGRYLFSAVNAGETYVISAKGKRFTFSQPAQLLNLNEDAPEVDFIANP